MQSNYVAKREGLCFYEANLIEDFNDDVQIIYYPFNSM